jgi:hypothetical protein
MWVCVGFIFMLASFISLLSPKSVVRVRRNTETWRFQYTYVCSAGEFQFTMKILLLKTRFLSRMTYSWWNMIFHVQFGLLFSFSQTSWLAPPPQLQYVMKPPERYPLAFIKQMKFNILANSDFHNIFEGRGAMLGDISLLFGGFFSQMYPHLFGTCLCTWTQSLAVYVSYIHEHIRSRGFARTKCVIGCIGSQLRSCRPFGNND